MVTDSKRQPVSSEPEPFLPISYRFNGSTEMPTKNEAVTINAKNMNISIWILSLSGGVKFGFDAAVIPGQNFAPHSIPTLLPISES